MEDRSIYEAALQREEQARTRKARALDHQKLAEQKTEAASDPVEARRLRREAHFHGRAATLHERATEIQADHARAHAATP